jgi:hypothetical protein
MAVVKELVAAAPKPMALELNPLASADCPIAVASVFVARAFWPTAVEKEPLARAP